MAIKIRHRIRKQNLHIFNIQQGSSHLKTVAEKFATLHKIVPSRTPYNNGVKQLYDVYYSYEASGADVGNVVNVTVVPSAGQAHKITVVPIPQLITLQARGSGIIAVTIAHVLIPPEGETVFFSLELHLGTTIDENYANYYAD